MITIYYGTLLAISLILLCIYFVVWDKHYNVLVTLMFVLVPIVDVGYVLMSVAKDLDGALIANCFVYIGGTYLSLLIMLCILSLCKIRLPKVITFAFLVLSTVVYSSVLTVGWNGLFYRSVAFEAVDGAGFLTKKVYGPMHTVFVAMLVIYFVIPMIAIIYSLIRKNSVSNKSLILLFIGEIICLFGYFGGRILDLNVDLIPATFSMAQVIVLIIVRKIYFYDITGSGIDSIEKRGNIGFISFDTHMDYLGCNELAMEIFPELRDLQVDRPVPADSGINKNICNRIKQFELNNEDNTFYKEVGDSIYKITVNHLVSMKKKWGYQFMLTDDTENQKYISLLDNFNSRLQKEVDEKTKDIVAMHDNLILSMATMVESRDNSTGGHIRRTSDIIRILTDVISKDNSLGLSETFIHNLIKAAPMHDLGKIAVDDQILRKPGKYTPEEFDIMKTHAAEGGRIVHEILKNTEDREFAVLAENVAHYHHERWDGSGYPEGLKGDNIPIEARIMAIADVYDALVSKRVYKERMSFEKADSIIMEGMGKHFDKALEPYYVAARPMFEKYYTENDTEE